MVELPKVNLLLLLLVNSDVITKSFIDTLSLETTKDQGQEQVQPRGFVVDKFLFGPYVINLNLTQTDEEGNITTIATVSKLVISFPYIGLVVLVILSLVLISFQLRKKWIIQAKY